MLSYGENPESLCHLGHQRSAHCTRGWLTYLSHFAAETAKEKLTKLLDSSLQDGVVC